VKLLSDASFLPPVDLEARIAAAAALVMSQSRAWCPTRAAGRFPPDEALPRSGQPQYSS
jgi:hypothetical protein